MLRSPLISAVLAATLLSACGRMPLGADAARAHGAMKANADLISTVTGDPPNFAQFSNGHMMTVVSREFGRGAKAGALVELFWPDYAADNLWDSYVGVVRGGGKATWAHQLKLVKQALVPDTGRSVTVFEGTGLRLAIEDVMRPDGDVHLRRATLTNTGAAPINDAALANFSYYMLNQAPTGDKAAIVGGALVQQEAGVAVAVVADVAPDAARTGIANMPLSLPLGGSRDARMAAEGGDWKGPQAAGPSVGGVNAVTRHALPALAPGASASTTWAIAIAANPDGALEMARGAAKAGFDAAATADAQRWGQWLAGSRTPAGATDTDRAVYRRALLTLGQHFAANGAVIAAPTNLNPPYRFVWPRDGSLIAETMLLAGRRSEAERFFEFAEKLQKPDGSFAVNYFPDGKKAFWDFGLKGNEHDQPGTFAWGVHTVFQKTGDRQWLAARWPAVKRACDHLLTVQDASGLLTTCRDLWELETDGTWAYSNAAAASGLLAGAAIADTLGDTGVSPMYRQAAERLREAIGTRMIGGADGWFVRGIRRGKVDTRVEAANLALGAGGFGLFDDNDPRMIATGNAVATRLKRPGGGTRRYDNDPYYNGQPWPVATNWYAQHRMGRGDKAAGREAIALMNRWAGSNESLMLGEQFNEGTKRWASAFPLAWSEAAYVKLSLDLAK